MKKRYNLLLLILFVITSASIVLAQPNRGTIKGKVLTSDNKPADNVTVALQGTKYGTITNENGEFNFKAPAGSYTIHVSAIGLATEEKPIVVNAGSTATLNFMLKENAHDLKEVAISDTKRRYKADNPSPNLRLNEPLLQVPQNIQVITGDQIKEQQIFSMLEGVSRNVSGVTMQEHWGNYARLNMRGARIAPFRNGMNVESTWGPLAEDMSFVERIEFVKGPAGFMLANGDPAGFYNVVTKKPTGITRQSVDFTYGSFNTYRATADLDGKLSANGKLLYRLNVMGQLQDSWRQFDFTNRYSIAPVLRYQIDAKNMITAEYTYQFARQAILGSAYLFSTKGYADLSRKATSADPNLTPTNMYDNSAFLTYEHKFNDKWKLTAQGAYFYYNQKGSSMWIDSIRTNGDEFRYVSSWDARNKSKYGQIFLNGELKTGAVAHRILGGIDLGDKRYIADWNQYFPLDNRGTAFNIYNPVYGNITVPQIDRSKPLSERAGGNNLAQRYGAVYIQDELGFFDNKLRVTLAGRYTTARTIQYADTIKNNRFSPRVGLSYSIDDQTSVYGLYDQAFTPQAGNIRSGETVKPITGNNIEAGLKRDWFNGRWASTLSVYQITKNNQLIADPTNPNFSIQLGQTETKGIEADIRGEVITGLNLMLNYAYTDSKVTKDPTTPARVGRSVPGFAKHVTNAWLSYKLQGNTLHGLGLALGYQWQLSRLGWSFDEGAKSDLPNYFRLDGAVTYQIKKVSFGVNVNNILDKYLYSGGHQDYLSRSGNTVYMWQAEAPRNIRASIGYRF